MKVCRACCACICPKKPEDQSQKGYSVEEFVNDGLVPVWGYGFWKPRDDRRQKELAQQLHPLNHRICQFMDARRGRGVKPRDGLPKESELPIEVVCVVSLTKI